MNIKAGNAGEKKKEGSEEEATKGGDYDEKCVRLNYEEQKYTHLNCKVLLPPAQI